MFSVVKHGEGGMGSTVPCGAQLGQGSKNPTTNSVGDRRSPEEFGAALRSKPLLRGKLSFSKTEKTM